MKTKTKTHAGLAPALALRRFAAVAAVLLTLCLVFMMPAAAESDDLPKAIVTETGRDTFVSAVNGVFGNEVGNTPVTFTMNFAAVDSDDGTVTFPYDEWYADFELTVNKDVRGVDAYLVGHYEFYCDIMGECAWVKLGDVENQDVLISRNTPIKIMSDVMGMSITYKNIRTDVRNFDCGIYFTPEFIKANPDLEVKLALKMYSPDGEQEEVIGEYVFNLVAENDRNKERYASLHNAIENAEKGDTIVLINDVTLTETLTIPADEEITLDLNGKTIGGSQNSGTSSALIVNRGSITILDNVGTGKITTSSSKPGNYNPPEANFYTNTISNYGTLIVESGTIENTATGNACYAIDNYHGSTTTIEGGTITAVKTAVRVFDWEGATSLTIAGGSITGTNGYGINFNMGNTPDVSLTITGGTITGGNADYPFAVYIYMDTSGSAENIHVEIEDGEFNGIFVINGKTQDTISEENIAITGGTFNGGTMSGYTYSVVGYGSNELKFISGGTFANDVSEYVADDYICIARGATYFEVIKKPEKAVVPETPELTPTEDDSNKLTIPEDSKIVVDTETVEDAVTIKVSANAAVSVVIPDATYDETSQTLILPKNPTYITVYDPIVAESGIENGEALLAPTVALELTVEDYNGALPVIDTAIHDNVVDAVKDEESSVKILAMITALGDTTNVNENLDNDGEEKAIKIVFQIPKALGINLDNIGYRHVKGEDVGEFNAIQRENIQESEDGKYYLITIYGERFSSYVLVEEEPAEDDVINDNTGGSATDTGSGNYQYYPRSVPTDGIISFGTSKIVTGMELPAGSDGKVTLNIKPDFDMPENGYYAFEIDAPGYNLDAKINGGLSFQIPVSELERAGFTEKDIVLFHGTAGEDGKITWEALPTNLVKNENGIAYYKAAINGCSPFYIGFVKNGAIINEPIVEPTVPETPVTPNEPETLPPADTPETPETPASPAPILAILAGLGAVAALRRK